MEWAELAIKLAPGIIELARSFGHEVDPEELKAALLALKSSPPAEGLSEDDRAELQAIADRS